MFLKFIKIFVYLFLFIIFSNFIFAQINFNSDLEKSKEYVLIQESFKNKSNLENLNVFDSNCIFDYECSKWSECVFDFQNRYCENLNSCSFGILETRRCEFDNNDYFNALLNLKEIELEIDNTYKKNLYSGRLETGLEEYVNFKYFENLPEVFLFYDIYTNRFFFATKIEEINSQVIVYRLEELDNTMLNDEILYEKGIIKKNFFKKINDYYNDSYNYNVIVSIFKVLIYLFLFFLFFLCLYIIKKNSLMDKKNIKKCKNLKTFKKLKP